MGGDFFSYETYQSIKIFVQKCVNSDLCYDEETISEEIQNLSLLFVTVDSYYDSKDQDHPIKQYLNIGRQLSINIGWIGFLEIKVTPNTVHFVSNSSRTFYTTEYGSQDQIYTPVTDILAVISISLSQRNILIEESLNMQPILNQNRMLNSPLLGSTPSDTIDDTSSDYAGDSGGNSHNDIYVALFVMAQIGGLYSFLKLVFTSLLSIVSFDIFMVNVVNHINEKKVNLTSSFRSKRYATMSKGPKFMSKLLLCKFELDKRSLSKVQPGESDEENKEDLNINSLRKSNANDTNQSKFGKLSKKKNIFAKSDDNLLKNSKKEN